MILLTHQTRIQLGVQPADFRKGIDGFVALCKNELHQNPRDQSVFVFINRARTMIRALSYDGSGYWLMSKRLSQGKFKNWPTTGERMNAATARELRLIISGQAWTSDSTTTADIDVHKRQTSVTVSATPSTSTS